MQRTAPDGAIASGRLGLADERALLVAAAGELVLGVWTCLSLLGIALGLMVASLAQAWAQAVLAPGAVVGGVLVLASAGLTLLASHRYLWRGATLPCPANPSRPLAIGSVCVVVGVAWAALAIIFATGWEFPIALLWRPVSGGE